MCIYIVILYIYYIYTYIFIYIYYIYIYIYIYKRIISIESIELFKLITALQPEHFALDSNDLIPAEHIRPDPSLLSLNTSGTNLPD